MKKFLVETYYTCTFKTVHSLENLNDKELSKIDERTDGDVEVIDVKLNNRKTRKIGDKKEKQKINDKILKNPVAQNLNSKIFKNKKEEENQNIINPVLRNNKARFKMPDRRKGYIQKLRLVIIKFIYILVNTTMVKSGKYLLIRIKKES